MRASGRKLRAHSLAPAECDRRRTKCDPINSRETMPLPTPPSKLGNLLPPDEYKAKAATPARSAAKKQAVGGESAESADYGRANVATPMAHAANAATTLRPVPASSASPAASASAEQAAPARAQAPRKSKQTAALLQPVPAARPQAEPAAVHARCQIRSRSSRARQARKTRPPARPQPQHPARAAPARNAARPPTRSKCRSFSCSTRTC